MSLNWVEIDKVLEELPLEGCFLQNIRQTSFHHLIFELYSPGSMGESAAYSSSKRSLRPEQQAKRATSPGRTIQLLICLDRQNLRIHETEIKRASLSKPPRFTSLLRSRIKGSRIVTAVQLGQERIVRLDLKKGDENFRLYIRLWGGASNLFLCEPDGKILDAFSRRPTRKEIPGEYYNPEEMEAGSPGKTFTLKEDILEDNISYNSCLDRYYQSRESDSDITQLRTRAERALDSLENQYQSGLSGLRLRLREYEKEEEQRRMGDSLMAALHIIKKGDREFLPEDSYTPIPLDPRKSPVENAREYYKKAGKAARGRSMTEDEAALLEKKLLAIEKKRLILEETDDPAVLKDLVPQEEIRNSRSEGKKTPGLTFYSGGFTLLTGRNARENDELLRRHVRGNDYWLHTRDFAGGYIFIRTPRGKSIPLEVLLDAGNLAVFYSKAKKSGQGDVYYTQVKFLRRPKEGKKGLVLPTKEKNLFIKLDKKRISRLRDEGALL